MRRLGAAIRQSGGRWTARLAAVFVLATVVAAAMAGPELKSPSRQWAMIIAVKNYAEKGDFLPYTVNDARWLKSALTECGVPENQILMMTDDSPPEKQPRLENLRKELGRFLGRDEIGPNDRMFVFFSGHGVASGEETYLKPSDSRGNVPERTALPVSEVLRAMRLCKARFKLLALDCCHAGGTKGSVVARDLGPDCVVLASCKPEQESFSLTEKERGIFTYWLCVALEGEADQNADGQLSVDEVFRFTRTKTLDTAYHARKLQEPVCHGLSPGSNDVLFPAPRTPNAVWTRVARRFANEIGARGLKKILVAEFRERTARGSRLVPAPFPAQCRVALRNKLIALAPDEKNLPRYEVLRCDPPEDFPVDGPIDEAASRGLQAAIPNVDAIVVGTLELHGRSLDVHCELIGVSDHRVLATADGAIALDEERIVLMGASLDNRTRPSGPSTSPEVVDHALSRARVDNPLPRQAGGFPFRIEVWPIEAENEGPAPRRCEYIALPAKESGEAGIPRHHLAVAAPSGKKFEIRVWNNGPKRVAMTLLVDGINTLGKTVDPPGPSWSWVLNPTSDPSEPSIFKGYFSHPETADNQPERIEGNLLNPFVFHELARPIADARRYGEPSSIITAVFYAEKRDEAMAVGDTPDAAKRLGTAEFRAGTLLGAIHIRYIDERAFLAR